MRGSFLAALVLVGCGSEILRPVEIDVLGLSARAEVLVLKVIPGDVPQCESVGLASVQGIAAPHESRWTRSEGQPRRASLPTVEEELVTIVGHSEDASGVPIQFLCRHLSFEEIADLPFGVLELTLSRREG